MDQRKVYLLVRISEICLSLALIGSNLSLDQNGVPRGPV